MSRTLTAGGPYHAPASFRFQSVLREAPESVSGPYAAPHNLELLSRKKKEKKEKENPTSITEPADRAFDT